MAAVPGLAASPSGGTRSALYFRFRCCYFFGLCSIYFPTNWWPLLMFLPAESGLRCALAVWPGAAARPLRVWLPRLRMWGHGVALGSSCGNICKDPRTMLGTVSVGSRCWMLWLIVLLCPVSLGCHCPRMQKCHVCGSVTHGHTGYREQW